MSRSKTQKFIVGQFRDEIPQDKLPTERDVLKFLFHKQHEESLKSKKSPSIQALICCPLEGKSHQVKCESNDLCTEESPCVVRAVKVPWLRAGFPVVSDRSITSSVLRLVC